MAHIKEWPHFYRATIMANLQIHVDDVGSAIMMIVMTAMAMITHGTSAPFPPYCVSARSMPIDCPVSRPMSVIRQRYLSANEDKKREKNTEEKYTSKATKRQRAQCISFAWRPRGRTVVMNAWAPPSLLASPRTFSRRHTVGFTLFGALFSH